LKFAEVLNDKRAKNEKTGGGFEIAEQKH